MSIVETKAKALAGAVITALVGYIGNAIVSGTVFTLHGIEIAAAGAVLGFIGVHQAPANKTKLTSIPAVYHHRLPERPVPGKPLGRHVEHDERSRNYRFHAAAPETLKSVRHARHVPVFDQGQVGSCTGNAGAGALSTAPFTHRYTESRALKFYSAAEVLDGDGPYPPNDNGSSGLSIAKVLKAEGLIGSYSHCFNAAAVYTALQDGPVLLGVGWLTGFDTPDTDGRMHYSGSSRGGHELCMDEIDVENQRVWITNSWSKSWGVQGRAYWTFTDFAKILADQGDVTVLDR